MKKSEIMIIQKVLKDKQYTVGDVDGIQGPKTNKAVQLYLEDSTSHITISGWTEWSAKRKIVAALQLLCQENSINAGSIDGLYGPQTETASDQLVLLKNTGFIPRSFADIEPLNENPLSFPLEKSKDLTTYYGKPGKVKLVKVTCPWKLRLDWELSKTTTTISIHEKLGESLGRILQKVYEHYGEAGIKKHGLDRYGGSYNCRKKRGSATSWSTHAWGIAIDWFPSKNKLKWRSDKATLADPELDFWWQCWEEEGWVSLGRTEDRDWMHVQAAKRK